MYALTLTKLALTATETLSSDAVNDISNSITTQNNLIGIGGIIATLIATGITCYVTWRLTMKNMKHLKLAYRCQIFPIISNSVAKNAKINLTDWEIKYKDKLLTNPCLLTIDILNLGNASIINPPIKIETDKNIDIIPGYFEETPSGYEDKWCFEETDSTNSYALSLEHINPKQTVKARFFLDNFPKDKIIFLCPMPDIHIQEISSNIDSKTARKNNISLKNIISISLVALITIIFINIKSLYLMLSYNIFHYQLYPYLVPEQIILYILAMCISTIILSNIEIKKIDDYLFLHPKHIFYIQLFIIILYIILLALIIPNIISDYFLQIVIAAFTVVLFSLFVHISIIKKDSFM